MGYSINVCRTVSPAKTVNVFARVRGVYGGARLAAIEVIDPADRAWGLMAPAEYPRILARALERDWIPRFTKRGIDARAAWDR